MTVNGKWKVCPITILLTCVLRYSKCHCCWWCCNWLICRYYYWSWYGTLFIVCSLIAKGGSIAIGIIAGTVSCLGFRFLTPVLNKYLKLNDSCGIHNLHAMPGVIGGLSSIIAAGIGSSYGTAYGISYFNMFHWKTAQAGIQAAGLAISLAFGIFGML